MKKIIAILFSVITLNTFAVCTFTITSTSIASGYNMHPYTQQLQYTGASSGSITWSVSSGTLPTGLSLGTNNGQIAGAVGSQTNTTYTFVVSAMDHSGCLASRYYSVNFSNYQILNTDYVIYATQVNNAQQAPYYQDFDMVNNAYNKPLIVGVDPVTVSVPQTWYGNAPTYTLSITNGSNLTAVTSGTYTPTISSPGNINITTIYTFHYQKIGNQVFVDGVVDGTYLVPLVNVIFSISLPYSPGTFIHWYDATGIVSSWGGSGDNLLGMVEAVPSGNVVKAFIYSNGATPAEIHLHFSYTIL